MLDVGIVETPQLQESPTMNTSNMTPEQIERLAACRVKAKMGWFFHAALYVAVNLFLVTSALLMGKHWHFFPLIGWGIGLAIHGIVVWLKSSIAGHELRERMMAKERAALSAHTQG